MKHLRSVTFAVLSAALACSIQAQQGPSNALGDFTIERVLTPSGVTAPTTPNLPDVVLNAFLSGAIELHQVFTFNSADRTLEQWAYILPGKSALPYPNITSAPLADHYIIQVDSVALSQAHGPSAALVGHVVSNDVPTPFGDIAGSEVTLTFGYQGSGPSTRFGPIMESVTPLYGLYTATGVGSLSPNASSPKCTGSMLDGVYQYSLRGSIETTPGTWSPYVESGYLTADGSGAIKVFGTQHVGENIALNRLTATVVVNSDCTATITGNGLGMDVVVSNHGQRFDMIFTKPTIVAAMGTARLE